MSVTYTKESEGLREYEEKNCNEILSENFKKVKKPKFQKHSCVIGLQ